LENRKNPFVLEKKERKIEKGKGKELIKRRYLLLDSR